MITDGVQAPVAGEGEFNPEAFLSGRSQKLSGEPANAAPATPPAVAPVDGTNTPPAAAQTAPQGSSYTIHLSEKAAKLLMEQIGVESDADLDEEKLITGLTTSKQREQALRQQLLEKGVYESPKLAEYEQAAALDKSVAVKNMLMEYGMDEADAAEQVELFEISGAIDKQHQVYIKQIEKKKAEELARLQAQAEAELKERTQSNSGSMTTEQRETLTQLFNEQLEGVTEIAGVMLGTTPDEIEQTRKAHAAYLASGQFEKDLKASPAEYAQMAFIFKNIKTIQNIAMKKGTEMGKASILKRIQNPSVPQSGNAPVPNANGGEFNPEEFNRGRAQAREQAASRRS